MRPIPDCLLAVLYEVKPILSEPIYRSRYKSARGQSPVGNGEVCMRFFITSFAGENGRITQSVCEQAR